jgi:O-antigen/teichoic acid export membrane protein
MRMATSLFLAIAGLVASLVLVRTLGSEAYGVVGFVTATVGLAGLIAGGGLGVAATRELAASGIDPSAAPAVIVRGLVTLVAAGTAIGAAIGLALVAPRAADVLVAAAAATVCLLAGRNAAGAAAAVARGSGRPLRTDLAVLASSATILTGTIVVGLAGLGTTAALAVYALGGIAAVGVAIAVIRGLVRPDDRPFAPDLGAGRAFLLVALPYVLAGAAQQVIAHADVVILGVVRSTQEVGAYEPVLRLIDRLALFVPLLLVVGFMPMATRLLAAGRPEGFVDLYRRTARIGFWLGWPAVVALTVFPDVLVRAVFGPGFPVSGQVVRILALGYAVNLVGGPNAAGLVATGRRGLIAATTVAAMASSVLVAAIAIPNSGATGAAVATATGFVVLNLAVGVALARTTGAHPFAGSSAVFLLSGSVPLAIVAAASSQVGGVAGALALTTGAWLAWTVLTVATGLLPREDLRAIGRFRATFEQAEAAP